MIRRIVIVHQVTLFPDLELLPITTAHTMPSLASLALCTSCLFPTICNAAQPPPQHILSNPSNRLAYSIPTVHESAVLARRILNLSSIGTLSSVFPPSTPRPSPQHGILHTLDAENISAVPAGLDLSSAPIGLMDYYATCHPQPYSPTILAISIATTFRNAYQGSNISMSLRWQPPADAPPSNDIYMYSPANMPRFSLIGFIEPIPDDELVSGSVKQCFLDRHPDAEAWLPGNEIHESWWGRLVVQGVYWIGGFGDRAYIGWIPAEEWQFVEEKEIRDARLVGEDGYEGFAPKRPEGSEEL